MGQNSEMMMLIKHLDYDHLYRHLTEVNGKDTRGGYIEGKLELDPVLLSSQSVLGLKIYLVSDEKALANDRIHPNLLYMTRFEGKVRKRELESSTPMWKIELEIRDGVVYWWTESEAQLAGYKQRVCLLHPNPDDPRIHNILDLKDLHLTVIIPLQRTTANGIKIKDALNLRRQMARFEDWEDHDWEKFVKELESYYTKNGKSELDRVCLRFTLHLVEGEDKEDPNPCSEMISLQPITNTRSRHLGALNLIPETMISAQKTCCRVQRTIYLPSQFKLPPNAKDVYPRFVVGYPDQGDYCLDERVKQPKESDIKIFGQFWVFTTPLQSDHHIQQVYNDGLKIYLEAYRPKDRAVTDKRVEFVFATHEEYQINDGTNIVLCSSCLEHPDQIGTGETLVNSLKKLNTSGKAKPGTKRRRTRVVSYASETSISSGFVSPARSAFSPSYTQSPESNVSEDLMKEIDDMDEDIPIDNIDPSSFGNDIDINRLLETISENDVEVVDSSSMRPSVYPDLLCSAVRQSGINGLCESVEMSRSMHQIETESAYLGGYEDESATPISRSSMMRSAPMSRAPSSSAPGSRAPSSSAPGSRAPSSALMSMPPSSAPPMSLPPSYAPPMSMPQSSSETKSKRLSRPLARMPVPAPSPPTVETSIKTEPSEEKTTEKYSSGRSLMFPMGRNQSVSNWKQEMEQSNINDMSSDDTEEEFADIRRSVIKNDVMLSDGAKVESVIKRYAQNDVMLIDGAKVESVTKRSSMSAQRIEVKLEEIDAGDYGLECASLAFEDIKEEDEDLNEKDRPSVLELAEMFASHKEAVIKKEEVCDDVKTDSTVFGASIVQDVMGDKINEDLNGDAPVPGSLEKTECLEAPRGRASGSSRGRVSRSDFRSKNEDVSVPGIISSWLGDLFPAMLYLLTPFLVIFLAILLQFLWTTFGPNVQKEFPGGDQKIEDLIGVAEE